MNPPELLFEDFLRIHIWEPRVASGMRRYYYDFDEPRRIECRLNLDAEADAGNKAGTLCKIPRLLDRATKDSGTIANLGPQHVTAYLQRWARRPGDRSRQRQSRKSLLDDVRIIARMKARHYESLGHRTEKAEKLAHALLIAPMKKWPVAPLTRKADPEPKRLTRAKRLELQQVVPKIFGTSGYLLAFVAFLVALLIENGGRFEGLQRTRIKDIKKKTAGASWLPVMIIMEEPAEPNKPRIYWRTLTCSPLLKLMLKEHPDRDNPLAYLLANPFQNDGKIPCDEDTMKSIWGKLSRALKLDWCLGPRSLRVYYTTTASATGKSKAAIRRNIGQVQGSRTTTSYVRYEEDDLIDICDNMGFTQGTQDATCPHCKKAIRTKTEFCPHCRKWLTPTLDIDEARVNAYARIGLRLHRRRTARSLT